MTLLLLTLVACDPPIRENTAPKVVVDSPADGARYNEGAAIPVSVRVTDDDGDAPIDVTIAHAGVTYATGRLDASSGTVELVLEGLPDGELTLDVSATDPSGAVGARTWTLQINGAPLPPTLRVTPEVAAAGQDLVGELIAPASDPEGQPLRLEWLWSEGGQTALSGATFPGVLPGALTRSGQTWTFEVVVRETREGQVDAAGHTVRASVSVAIANDPPSAPSVRLLPGAATGLHALRCLADGAVDPQGDPVTLRYAWFADRGLGFVSQPALTGPTVDAATVATALAWRCEVTASDGSADSAPAAAAATVLPTPAVVDDVAPTTLSGTGGRLTALDTDGDGAKDLLVVSRGDLLVTADLADVLNLTGDAPLPELARVDLPGAARLLVAPDLDGVPGEELVVWGATGVTVVPGAWLGAAAGDLPEPAVAATLPLTPRDVAAAPLTGSARSELALGVDGLVHVVDGRDLAFPGEVPADISGIGAEGDVAAFGAALAAGGDWSGDGVGELFVGAPRRPEDGGSTCAILFNGGQLVDVVDAGDAILRVSHAPGEGCGEALAFLPDLDGDGRDELLVAAPDEDRAAGRVGLFLSGDALFSEVAFEADDDVRLIADNIFDRFGAALAVAGDVDGDALPELLVGAPGAAGGAGRVYGYPGAVLAGWAASATPGVATERSADRASFNVRGVDADDALTPVPVGDLDGDGLPELAVGSARADRVYLFWSGR